jgi:DNA polymerase IIIc chi subunit
LQYFGLDVFVPHETHGFDIGDLPLRTTPILLNVAEQEREQNLGFLVDLLQVGQIL